MSLYADRTPEPSWVNGPRDEPHGEMFASDIDDVIEKLKKCQAFIEEAPFGGNFKNTAIGEKLDAEMWAAFNAGDAQGFHDAVTEKIEAYAIDCIYDGQERDREYDSQADLDKANAVLKLYRKQLAVAA